MTGRPGPLVPADEHLHHQVVDTFGRVGTTDRSWTEKVAAMAGARDGSAQLYFGFGKYQNRGVMDAFGALSVGAEQWTVRASREIATDHRTRVGPLVYDIVSTDPPVIRIALEQNDESPLTFEWIARSDVPPFLEEGDTHVSRDGLRIDADVVRFHQAGSASGWYEVDGARTEFDETAWVATRDRSWGIRYGVGAPLTDVIPAERPPGLSTYVLWSPQACRDGDGTPYGIFLYIERHAVGGFVGGRVTARIEHPDGRLEVFPDVDPRLRFDARTRRLLGGELDLLAADGSRRILTMTPLGETGACLGAGLYGGLDGHFHGGWRGPMHVEAEHVADCRADDVLYRYGQLRAALVRVDDPAVAGVGHGDVQTIISGAHPELGLEGDGPPY